MARQDGERAEDLLREVAASMPAARAERAKGEPPTLLASMARLDRDAFVSFVAHMLAIREADARAPGAKAGG